MGHVVKDIDAHYDIKGGVGKGNMVAVIGLHSTFGCTGDINAGSVCVMGSEGMKDFAIAATDIQNASVGWDVLKLEGIMDAWQNVGALMRVFENKEYEYEDENDREDKQGPHAFIFTKV